MPIMVKLSQKSYLPLVKNVLQIIGKPADNRILNAERPLGRDTFKKKVITDGKSAKAEEVIPDKPPAPVDSPQSDKLVSRNEKKGHTIAEPQLTPEESAYQAKFRRLFGIYKKPEQAAKSSLN